MDSVDQLITPPTERRVLPLAVAEAAELWAAEQVDAARLRGGPDGLAWLGATSSRDR
jgi:hypothetical protein